MNMNNSSRAMSMGMTHHQIQSSGGGSFGDEMDSTIGLEFSDDLDGGQSHTHFSRKVAASYYDQHHQHHMGVDEDDHMMDFQVKYGTLIETKNFVSARATFLVVML